MAFFATESVQEIFKDPHLQIFTDPTWGSEHPGHRERLHHKAEELKSSGTPYLSISHCEGRGILVGSVHPVGVDVEQTARLTDKVVARVSTVGEKSQAPSAAALWCAKEACFKALKTFTQPSVISQISIGDWQKIDSQLETCRLMRPENFHAPSENIGIFVQDDSHSYCFFIFRT